MAKKTLLRHIRPHAALLLVFVLGVVLRTGYTAATPFDVRGYDTKGHIQYIAHMIESFSIPSPGDGWEMHQAPLYYAVAAGVAHVHALWGGADTLMRTLQFLSLFASIATLGVSVWISFLLFPKPKDTLARTLFCAVIATVPGFVFFSSRITNDNFMALSTFLSVALMLRWQKTGEWFDWLLLSTSIGVGLLTKLNIVLVLPPIAIALLLRKNMSWSRKGTYLLLLATISGAIASPYLALRLSENYFTGIVVSNGKQIFNSKLLVTNTVDSYTTFRIVQNIINPFVSPWGEQWGKQFFWEYVFKSALFGEWVYQRLFFLGGAITFSGMVTLAFGAWGAARSFSRQKTWTWMWPFFVLLITAISSLAWMRFHHHCACHQDFRLGVVMILPIAAACASTAFLPRHWKEIATWCIGAFCLFCSVFVLLVPFYG